MRGETPGCRSLVDYLEKESTSHSLVDYMDKESRLGTGAGFFDSTREDIPAPQVVDSIDNNCRKLSYSETRFYSMTLNPSPWELAFMQEQAEIRARQAISALQSEPVSGFFSDPMDSDTGHRMLNDVMREMLQEYAKKAMDEYALNFKREGIESGADLVWFGRVEENRYWDRSYYSVRHNENAIRKIERAKSKGDMQEVKKLESSLYYESEFRKGGKKIPVRAGMAKSGLHHHIHIIVSRRDREQRYKLSPESKGRGNDAHQVGGKTCRAGFDRNRFNVRCEQSFDEMFGYRRHFYEMYESRKLLQQDPAEYEKQRRAFYAEFYKDENRRMRERWLALQRNSRMGGEFDPSRALLFPIHRIAYEAGLRQIESIKRPYRNLGSGVMDAVKLSRQHLRGRELAEQGLKWALGAYASAAGLSAVTAPLAPHLAVAGMLHKGVSRLNVRGNDQER